MSEFKFNDAAVALEMRKVERRGGSSDDMRHVALAEIARQLREAGAPDAPLEEQLRAMLASHVALARTGEAMPSEQDIANLIGRAFRDNQSINVARTYKQAGNVLDLFRPIFARLTQERDEARANHDRSSDACRSLADEIDALRQRAERAERERGESKAAHSRALAAMSEQHGLVVSLRACIAELEAPREPGADAAGDLADMVEDMLHAGKTIDEAVRAVIAHLAAMGEEAWPTAEDLAICAWNTDAEVEWKHAQKEDRAVYMIEATAIRSLLRSRLSLVLGALRARVAELDARNAELHAYADEKNEQYKACAARQMMNDKRIVELEARQCRIDELVAKWRDGAADMKAHHDPIITAIGGALEGVVEVLTKAKEGS